MSDDELKEALLLWAQEYCKMTWEAGFEPAGVKLFANQAVEWIKTQNGITSESLGDYSVTFLEEGAMPKGLLALLRPYRKVQLI